MQSIMEQELLHSPGDCVLKRGQAVVKGVWALGWGQGAPGFP